MKIGFIGLGIMGSRMAKNLINNGYELIVYNRTKEKADEIIKIGAKYTDDICELAKESYIVFTMLSTPGVVWEMALSENGFVKYMQKNSIWVDCSTVNPSFSTILAEKVKEYDVRFVDAPVAGSLKPAESGELTFLAGGEKLDLDEIKPMLNVMGKKIIHAGENGKGSALKMMVNMLMGISMAAFSEAMNLGENLGFEKQDMLDTLLELPVVAPILKLKKDKFISGDYSTEFPLKWMQKDLHLASLSAFEKDISMPVLNSVKEVFAMAKQMGLSDKDFSAIAQLNNIKVENNEN